MRDGPRCDAGLALRRQRMLKRALPLASGAEQPAAIPQLCDNRDIYGLVDAACDWLDGYLRHNPEASDDDRALCALLTRS